MRSETEKARESRLRRAANRHGCRLTKSRSRDPNNIDFGLYSVIDNEYNCIVNEANVNSIYAWTLDDVEGWVGEQATEPVAA